MKHRVALVTGGNSGLGACTVRRLARNGFRVGALDLSVPDDAGGTPGVRHMQCDVTDNGAVAEAVSETVMWGGRLDLVVTCAGLVNSELLVGDEGPASASSFRRTMDVNLVGTFNVLTHSAAAMTEQEVDEHGVRGVLITVGSLAARDGQRGTAAYSASKAAVAAMTRVAARDLAPLAIRCVGIAPGTMSTPMVANLASTAQDMLGRSFVFPRRPGEPEEFAALVVALSESHYVNGTVVAMDGAAQMPVR